MPSISKREIGSGGRDRTYDQLINRQQGTVALWFSYPISAPEVYKANFYTHFGVLPFLDG